jgi:hypothetical protein
MQTREDTVEVKFTLPRALVEKVSTMADRYQQSIDEQVRALLERSLLHEPTALEMLQQAREEYAAELARAGKPRPTTEELWEQMRRIREEVANERYPD